VLYNICIEFYVNPKYCHKKQKILDNKHYEYLCVFVVLWIYITWYHSFINSTDFSFVSFKVDCVPLSTAPS
jgi:hypothetical protein